jgi:adenine deaminase
MQTTELIAVARGERPADLVLRGGRLIDVLAGEVRRADVAVAGGLIAAVGEPYEGEEVVDLDGAHLAPAFIDGHIHVEGTLLTPFELARTVCARGTGTLVADPHEIGNVHGVDGVLWMLENGAGAPADVLYTAPSCVPASPLETSGARIGPAEIERLLDTDGVIGLAEVMDFPAVIAGGEEILTKIGAAAARGLPIDGHAPGLGGAELAAYVAAGPGSEHEATSEREGAEKLRAGMRLMLREGTVARDLRALLGALTPANSRRCMMVNDDVSVADLLVRGHLDHHLRLAVGAGVDPVTAIRMVTLNPAEWFGLGDRGAIAAGRRADLAVLADLSGFEAVRTYHRGHLVAADGRCLLEPRAARLPPPSVSVDWGRVELSAPAQPGDRARVIEVTDGAIVTGAGEVEAPTGGGRLAADPGRDLALLCTVERHHRSGRAATGLARGLGLRAGALGSTVAHDHHNVILAGVDRAELELAGRRLTEIGGGFVAVRDGAVLAEVPLPIAGLMSAEPAAEVAATHRAAIAAARELGSELADPFMTLSFLGLEVIGELKLTDLGLVDVGRFELVDAVLPAPGPGS